MKDSQPCVCAQADFGDCDEDATYNFLDESDFGAPDLASMHRTSKLKHTPSMQTSVSPPHVIRACMHERLTTLVYFAGCKYS
jgi:hypothetical protein